MKRTKKVISTGLSGIRARASLEMRPELDIHGMRVEEALTELERYIDDAVLSGLHYVTINHGKGTGVLRGVVQQSLRENRSVRGVRRGNTSEGGDGVTIVELR